MRRLSDKLAHIDAALDGGSEVPGARRPGALTLEQIRLRPAALPECDLAEVDTSTSFLGKRIAAPVMVSPMTGGLQRGGDLNRRMARAAEEAQIPFGVGSQRVALEVESRAKDFQVRDVAPTIPLLANLGAVQLVKGYSADHALRAVEMIQADALYLHLNAMQEVVQEGGDTQWTGVLRAIEAVCQELARRAPHVPVFAREVGFGLPREDVRRLIEAGVAGVDCAGGGGTSWSLVEGRVAEAEAFRQLGDVFAGLGTDHSRGGSRGPIGGAQLALGRVGRSTDGPGRGAPAGPWGGRGRHGLTRAQGCGGERRGLPGLRRIRPSTDPSCLLRGWGSRSRELPLAPPPLSCTVPRSSAGLIASS